LNVGVAGRRRGRRLTGRTLCQTRSPSFDAACELSNSMSKEWRLQVCDAPRCPELHARYTAEAQQGGPGLAASAACPGTCPNSTVPLGNLEDSLKQGLSPVNSTHQQGMPCMRGSPSCTELDPAICTHRPSLLPFAVPQRLWEGFGSQHNRCASAIGSKSRNKVAVGEPAAGSWVDT
jgi:hypothetical protein